VKPRLLDLFCGAGGAGTGYHRAGFDVVGVDINPQRNYPFEFVQADALEFLRDIGTGFDAIHASPPCQDHSKLKVMPGYVLHGTAGLLADTRVMLIQTARPWVIENVPGSPMRADYKLCGCMFGLPGLRRERWFETSWRGYELRTTCSHTDHTITVAGHAGGSSARDGIQGCGNTAAWKRAMGIDWMTGKELAQAIPPAYTRYIGEQFDGGVGGGGMTRRPIVTAQQPHPPCSLPHHSVGKWVQFQKWDRTANRMVTLRGTVVNHWQRTLTIALSTGGRISTSCGHVAPGEAL
jgi:DNA (cytosine-5)-methyltransferase 1